MLRSPESITVVGPSFVGKTTLVNGLRGEEYADRLVIPKRFISRPPRKNDSLIENIHVSPEDFRLGALQGKIRPYWMRYLEDNRRVDYGFEPVDEDDDRLPIFSANNAFLRDVNESVRPIIASGLVVVVKAEHERRTSRMQKRSPDMEASEAAIRLADIGGDFAIGDFEQRIIDTTDKSDAEGQLALREIVDDVLAKR